MWTKVMIMFVVGFWFISDCPAAFAKQPATEIRPIAASSTAVALKAVLSAASATNWTITTISAEAGYILAERGVTVLGGEDKAYRLEVNLLSAGEGNIQAKVSPPLGVLGAKDPKGLVTEFLDAYERALE